MQSRTSYLLQSELQSQLTGLRKKTTVRPLPTFIKLNRTSITSTKWFETYTRNIKCTKIVYPKSRSTNFAKVWRKNGMKWTGSIKNWLMLGLLTLSDSSAARKVTRNSWLRSKQTLKNWIKIMSLWNDSPLFYLYRIFLSALMRVSHHHKSFFYI